VISGPILTTSKSFPVRPFSVFNSSSFHRESDTPDRNPEISTPAFKRTRIPIGGNDGSVLALAKCRAG